jgi:hypothetical protein
MAENDQGGRWMSIADAAAIVGYEAVSLRRAILRHAGPAGDGAREAAFDGIIARKLAGTWRVALSASWTRSR